MCQQCAYELDEDHEGPVTNNGHISAADLLALSFSRDLFVAGYLLDRMKSEVVKTDVIPKVDSATDVVSYEKVSALNSLHSMEKQPEQFAGRG